METDWVTGRPRRRVAAGAAVALATALLAGCSGAGEQMSAGVADRGSEGAAAVAPESQEQSGEQGAPGTTADVDVSDRTRIHTADLSVEVDDVEAAAQDAAEWVDAAGGFVAAESVTTARGEVPGASLTLRIPQERYEDGLDELGALGERSDLDRSVQDVTEEVADVDSRVESAEASLERLRDLLDDAATVSDVLAVETEISTRQADLESLLARQESLAEQTAMGTVHLNLMPPESYVGRDGGGSIGFVGGLERGWLALVAVGQGIAVGVGWLLPFLVVLAVPGVPALIWWRRRRRAAAAAAGRPAEGAGAPAADTPAADAAATGEEPDTAGADDAAATADGGSGAVGGDGSGAPSGNDGPATG
ncbi:DUF4349 domain-containing protein [Nocardiopsis sediminis]|uniref:DUF4349 domain-containing protein n=1 Tax=Nocardiopsis sediminis TaxID=1778267 RepID=A0ABV8FNU9_9ACTN